MNIKDIHAAVKGFDETSLRHRFGAFVRAPFAVKRALMWRSTLATFNSMKRIVALYAILAVAGIAVFVSVESQNVVDSFYWMATTSSTTGYGDFAPHTDAGKMIVSLFMLSWYVLGAIFLANLVTKILQDPHILSDAEQRFSQATERRSEIRQIVIDENLRRIAERLFSSIDLVPRPEFDEVGNVTNIDLQAITALPELLEEMKAVS